MPKLTITTQLIGFLIIAIMLNFMQLQLLLVVFILFLAAIACTKNLQFYRLTKRLKWIYLVMLLMFAFNTPGEHVHGWPFSLSPTHEGLLIGFTQILRITIVLAVLSLILAVNTKQQLIAGFYYLLLPLKFFGLDVERFAARLWLTLHYAEIERPKLTKTDFSNNLARSLGEIFNRAQHEEIVIILEKPVHTWLDYLLIILMLAFLSLATFRNFA